MCEAEILGFSQCPLLGLFINSKLQSKLNVTLNCHDGCHGTYPWVHKDEVHLHECENHLQHRVDAAQDLVAWWCEWDLEECSTFQPIVDHGAQSKCWNTTQTLFTIDHGTQSKCWTITQMLFTLDHGTQSKCWNMTQMLFTLDHGTNPNAGS